MRVEAMTTVDTASAPASRYGGSAPSPARMPEIVLGRYRLIERLGSGGFGEVWRAEDELLCRQVAVKRIPCHEQHVGQRAAREAHAAARLCHPAIVALYEALQQDGAFYLTSELVQGATLARMIAEDALADEEIFEIGLALCDALAHAHERGVIHRDVKPQNILIPDEPADRAVAAKLTDFGGARLDGEDALTRTGDVLGTLAYMAPEQCEGHRTGPESDLYSLALVLYEALSGENPVRAATPAATVRRIGEPLPPLRRLRGDLERPLTDAIDGALEVDPQDRGTIDDLAQALREALAAQGAPAEGDTKTARRRAPRKEPSTALISRKSKGVSLWAPEAADDLLAAAAPWPRIQGERIKSADWATTRQAPHPQYRHGGGLQASVPNDAHAGRGEQGAHMHEREDSFPPTRLSPAGTAPHTEWPLPRLPRILWTAAATAAIAWQAGAGRTGLALLLAAGALPLLIAMPRRARVSWIMPALAPLLGLLGLASAYPALAGLQGGARMRACLGALGYWWLCLAEIGFSAGLAPAVAFTSSTVAERHQAGMAWSVTGWQSSPAAAVHAIGTLIGPAALCGAGLWALGALVLPWIVRRPSGQRRPRRRLGGDIALAAAWSATMLAGPPLLARWLQTHSGGLSAPLPAVLGALLGALLVLGVARGGGAASPSRA